jgi:threonine dehydratase
MALKWAQGAAQKPQLAWFQESRACHVSLAADLTARCTHSALIPGCCPAGPPLPQVGAETFRMCRQLVDGVVLVDNAAISGAIKDVFNETRSILEPAGAVAVRGIHGGGTRGPHGAAGRQAAPLPNWAPPLLVPCSALLQLMPSCDLSPTPEQVAGAKAWLKANGAKGRTVVAITSGANINFERLRLVSELADLGTSTEVGAALAV